MGMSPEEALENRGLIRLGYPETVVAHGDCARAFRSALSLGCDLDEGLALLRVAVFDAVRHEIHQDQLETRRVDDQIRKAGSHADLDASPRRHLLELTSDLVRDHTHVYSLLAGDVDLLTQSGQTLEVLGQPGQSLGRAL